jgi:hypothetical protein
MTRFTILTCIALTVFAASARAKDQPPFVVTSEATRAGDKISVSMKIVENKKELVPQVGDTNVTTTRATPQIVLREGRRAQMTMGRSRPAGGGAHPATAATDPADIDSGVKIDVISIKGQDNLLIVTTVVEDGSTVWAEAATIQIQPKPANDRR